MTKDDFLIYWRSNRNWFFIKDNKYFIKETAPEEARKSFEAWKKQQDFY